MISFRQFIKRLTESKQGTVVFVFGRCNPPTAGHEKLFAFAKSLAQRQGAEFRIYASHTQDQSRNPLSYEDKIEVIKKGMPSFAQNVVVSPRRTAFDIIEKDLLPSYQRVIFAVGEDRVIEFTRAMSRYPEVEVTAIKRPLTAVSATMARQAARQGDIDTFVKCMPMGLQRDKQAVKNLMFKLKNQLKESETDMKVKIGLNEQQFDFKPVKLNREITEHPVKYHLITYRRGAEAFIYPETQDKDTVGWLYNQAVYAAYDITDNSYQICKIMKGNGDKQGIYMTANVYLAMVNRDKQLNGSDPNIQCLTKRDR